MALSVKTAFRWHLWLGLASGFLMLVIGVSGAVAVFKAEINWLVTPALRAAHPPAGEPRATPDALMASLRAAYPGGVITALELAPAPGYAHQANVRPVGAGARSREVFLDPVTAAVRGDREIGRGYFWSVHNLVRQLHVRLLMGAWGRMFVGVFGVVLMLSCLTGLYVYRGWIAGLWRLRWHGLSGLARARELHKWVGLWSLLFNLLIAVTGAVLGLEGLAGRIKRDWLQIATATQAPPRATAVGAPLSVGTLVDQARSAFPDLRLNTITLPGRSGDPAILRGDVGFLIARNQNYVALDPVSGAVLAVADRRQTQGWERVYLTFDPLHFGYFGGYTVKAIWFLLGLAPGVLSMTGFWLWLRRRQPARMRSAFVPPASADRAGARRLAWGGAAATLMAAFALAGRTHGWDGVAPLIEHAIAKPLTLALVAFPVTGLLGWWLRRLFSGPARTGRRLAAILLAGSWYAGLVTLFQ